MKIKNVFYYEKYDPPQNEISLEWWLERFRNWRKIELEESDWTQLPDAPGNAQAWAIYRQQLRDLPSVDDFANAELPTRPE
jgi:hypothetical protein